MKECEIHTYTYKHFRLRRDAKTTRSLGVLVFSRALISPGCPLVIKERVGAKYHFTRIQLRNSHAPINVEPAGGGGRAGHGVGI